VRAHDGTVFGDWAGWQMTTQRATNVLPVVTAPAVKNVTQNEWVQLSSFITVTDTDLDPMVKFELVDGNASPEAG